MERVRAPGRQWAPAQPAAQRHPETAPPALGRPRDAHASRRRGRCGRVSGAMCAAHRTPATSSASSLRRCTTGGSTRRARWRRSRCGHAAAISACADRIESNRDPSAQARFCRSTCEYCRSGRVPNRLHRSWPLRRVLRQRLVGGPAPADTAWTCPHGYSEYSRRAASVRWLDSEAGAAAAEPLARGSGAARRCCRWPSAPSAWRRSSSRRATPRRPPATPPCPAAPHLPWCARCCVPSRLVGWRVC